MSVIDETEVSAGLDLRRYGYADGNYVCRCRECDGQFIGDKRARRCRDCALEIHREASKIDLRAEVDKFLRGEPLSDGVQAFVCPTPLDKDN